MKKVVAILLAGVLTVGASMTAFAAESPTVTAVSKNLDKVTSTDANVDVSAIEADEEGYDAAVDILADEDNTALATFVDNAEDYELTYLVDLTVDEAAITDGSYTVTLAVDGITASSDIVVLHYANGAWELIEATVSDGYVTFTLTSFSPSAIYVAIADTTSDDDSSTSDDDSDTSDDSDDDDTTSDETGEANVMLYVVMIAVIAAAGMAVSSKKRRA